MLPIFLIYEIRRTLASIAVSTAIFKLSHITPAYGIAYRTLT